MIDISFEVNGRKISPNSIGNTLEAAMLNSVKESISQFVGNVRCAEHGQKPKIKAKGLFPLTLTKGNAVFPPV